MSVDILLRKIHIDPTVTVANMGALDESNGDDIVVFQSRNNIAQLKHQRFANLSACYVADAVPCAGRLIIRLPPIEVSRT